MKRLYRSTTDKKIAGICGGLGEIFNLDPNLIRLLAVLLFFVTGFFPVVITYLIAWIIIPEGKPEEATGTTSEPTETPPRTEPQKPPTTAESTAAAKSGSAEKPAAKTKTTRTKKSKAKTAPKDKGKSTSGKGAKKTASE